MRTFTAIPSFLPRTSFLCYNEKYSIEENGLHQRETPVHTCHSGMSRPLRQQARQNNSINLQIIVHFSVIINNHSTLSKNDVYTSFWATAFGLVSGRDILVKISHQINLVTIITIVMTSLKNYVEFKEKCDGNKYSLNLSFLGKKKQCPSVHQS